MCPLNETSIDMSRSDYLMRLNNEIKIEPRIVCESCGAIKINAKELAKELYLLHEWIIQQDDPFEEQYGAVVGDLLETLVEPEPKCDMGVDNLTWVQNNTNRKCSFLKDYEHSMYIKFSDIVLYSDRECKCFMNEKRNVITPRLYTYY